GSVGCSALPAPPDSLLFPYTTLFRSLPRATVQLGAAGSILPGGRMNENRRGGPSGPPFARPRPTGARVETKRGWLHRQPRTKFRSEEHTSELQSRENLVCRLPREKKQ